jgi:hypothetical protein
MEFTPFAVRLETRWLVVRYAALAMVFWTGVVLLGAWLHHFGLVWVWRTFEVVWFYFMLPGIIAHLQMITDLLNYAATGTTRFFPLMQELIESGEVDRRFEQLPPETKRFLKFTMPIFSVAAITSPLIAPALWAMVVLVRMPASAHARAASRGDAKRALRMAHRFEASSVEEFAEKQFGRLAAAA